MLLDTIEPEKSKEWIALFHAGDREVIEELHARYADVLVAFFAARTFNHDSANDLSQTVWVKILEKRQSFLHGNFHSWMYRIARNLLIDHWRKKYPSLLDEDFDPAEPTYDQEDDRLESLRECLESVEGSFVEIIRSKTQGLSTTLLAKQYGISPMTVGSRFHRGKQLLKDCVERKTK